MARLDVGDEAAVVLLTVGEKVAALRGDLRFPLSSVRSVEVLADGGGATRGVRGPGLPIPGRRIGTWRRAGNKMLVSVRRRQPALRIALAGQPHGAILLGVEDPGAEKAKLERVLA